MIAKIHQNCADWRLTVIPALPAAEWAASLQDKVSYEYDVAERSLKLAVIGRLTSNAMSSCILEPPQCGGVVRLGLKAPRAQFALWFHSCCLTDPSCSTHPSLQCLCW